MEDILSYEKEIKEDEEMNDIEEEEEDEVEGQ